MHLRDVAITVLLLIPGTSLLASPITLDQALQEAFANNKDLKVKHLAIKTVEAERLKARLWSPSNPELEMEITTDALTSNSGEGTFQLGIGQEIELGGQRGNRTRIADAHIELAKLELQSTEQTLKREVRSEFYSLLLAQQRMAFVQYANDFIANLRDTAAIRVKNGFLPTSEFTFLDIEFASSGAMLNRTEAELNETKNRLLKLLNRTPDSEIEAVGEVTYSSLVVSEDSVVSLAVSSRLELKENKLRSAGTSAELNLANSERIPNLKISAFYSRQKSVFSSDNFIGNSAGIEGIKDTDHMFGIRFSLPLPLINRQRSEVARFRSETEENKAIGLSLENQIGYEARYAYQALTSAQSIVALLQRVQPESDSLLEKLQNAYSQGRIPISDYLVQRDRVLTMRLNLLDAYNIYISAQTECERATGLDWNEIQQGERK